MTLWDTTTTNPNPPSETCTSGSVSSTLVKVMFITFVVLRRLAEDGGFLLPQSTSEPPFCWLGLR